MFRLGRVIYHLVSGSGRQVTVQRARHTSLSLRLHSSPTCSTMDSSAQGPCPGETGRAVRGEKGDSKALTWSSQDRSHDGRGLCRSRHLALLGTLALMGRRPAWLPHLMPCDPVGPH